MVLGRIRGASGRVGEALVRPLLRLGVTANTLTWSTLALAIAGVAVVTRVDLFLGGWVFGLSFALDMLDGAAARASGGGTPFGAVLDATIDRLVDGLFILAVALWLDTTTGWVLAALAIAGSNAVSYAKARGEAEAAKAKRRWPLERWVLFERTERSVVLFAVVLLQSAAVWLDLEVDAVTPGLAVLAAGAWFTVGQRLWTARRALA